MVFDMVFANKKLLKGVKNPKNNRYVYINERLPETDNNVRKHAYELGLSTSTYNCAVSVYVKNSEGMIRPVDVRSTEAVDNLADKNRPKRT